MICKNCGAEIDDEIKFCTNCGTKIDVEEQVEINAKNAYEQKQEQQLEQEAGMAEEQHYDEAQETKSKGLGKKKLIVGAIAAVLILVVGGFMAYSTFLSAEAKYDKYMELAQKYLLEENYEEAIVAFNKAVEIDQKSLDARLGLADAYMGLGDSDKAIKQIEEALEIEPKKQAVWEKQADIYWQIEDIDSLNKLIADAEANKIVLEACEKAVIPSAPTIEVVKSENEQTLSFSADKDSEIYYTLDASDPKNNGEKYVAPIEALNGKYTIKAVAKSSQGVYSSVVTEEKEIENKMPLGRMNTRPFDYVGMTFGEIVKEIGPVEYELNMWGGEWFLNKDISIYIARGCEDSEEYEPNSVCASIQVKLSVLFPDAKGEFTKEKLDLAFGQVGEGSEFYEGGYTIDYNDFFVWCDSNYNVTKDSWLFYNGR